MVPGGQYGLKSSVLTHPENVGVYSYVFLFLFCSFLYSVFVSFSVIFYQQMSSIIEANIILEVSFMCICKLSIFSLSWTNIRMY